LNVSSGGLDANGNWIWNVTITPTATGTPLAAELGFKATGSGLAGATANVAVFDTPNPGTQIFNWEALTDVDTDPAVTNNRPVGLQQNTNTDEVFAALGSIDLTSGAATQFVTITTEGPTSTSLTTSLQVLGKYGTGNSNGRIAEITGTAATNYNNFAGTATRTALNGDADLNGSVSGADLATLAANFGKAGNFTWAGGDFNGSTGGAGEVSGADLATLAANFGKSGGVNTPLAVNGAQGAAAGLGASAVPEPASLALAGLAALATLGLTLRKRQK
jgi:hypothetical protein